MKTKLFAAICLVLLIAGFSDHSAQMPPKKEKKVERVAVKDSVIAVEIDSIKYYQQEVIRLINEARNMGEVISKQGVELKRQSKRLDKIVAYEQSPVRIYNLNMIYPGTLSVDSSIVFKPAEKVVIEKKKRQ